MSIYMTEEEQLDAIKKWWRRHGTKITTLMSIVFIAIAGYRYMTWHHNKLMQQASVTYEQMMVAFSEKNVKSVRSYASDLITNYDKTVYADAAHMTLAKIYVARNKLDRAQEELQTVASKSKMNALKQIAKIRIARILAAKESYSQALDELAAIDDKTYLPVINELKGDIYGATGKYAEAISSYKLAIEGVKTKGMGNLFLEMKTNELAIKNSVA